ncbi:MAG: hypothetical protein ACOZNI_21125 [Myxococcota bacterium]
MFLSLVALLTVACAPPPGAPSNACDEPGVICTVAGTGELGLAPDGDPAAESMLYWPASLGWHPDGRLLILDFNTHLLRTIEPDFTLGTLAGNGMHAASIVGVPATESPMDNPLAMDVTEDGRILIGSWHESRVRVVETDGTLRAYAGNGIYGYAGDGGAAQRAELSRPSAIAVGEDGRVWIADSENHVVREVAGDGTIETFAGTGAPGYGGDGGPARDATFRCPAGLWLGEGVLYVADTLNHAVRRIDLATETLTTVAGTGTPGFAGDGGSATLAGLSAPRGGAVGPDGALWIVDTDNHVVRRVDPDGTIATVVGTGDPAYDGDGGPAVDASLSAPRALLFDATGDLFVADMGNGVVRRVRGAAQPAR